MFVRLFIQILKIGREVRATPSVLRMWLTKRKLDEEVQV
jgi:hypothetical protein